MNVPEELRYTREHEWVKMGDGKAVIGITDHAQEELGDITFVELPVPGKAVSKGDDVAVIESVKAASDIYAPVSGTVTKVNDALEDAPETVNQSAYVDGWICEIELSEMSEYEELMDAGAYKEFIAE